MQTMIHMKLLKPPQMRTAVKAQRREGSFKTACLVILQTVNQQVMRQLQLSYRSDVSEAPIDFGLEDLHGLVSRFPKAFQNVITAWKADHQFC